MKTFLKKHKYFLMLLIVLGIGILAMFLPSLISGKYFVGGGDVKTQWYPFYILNRRATITSLKDHTLPFYSFVLFLGNNIWASKSSYGLFDIYNILTYVLDKNYFFIYDWIIIFCGLFHIATCFFIFLFIGSFIYIGNGKIFKRK